MSSVIDFSNNPHHRCHMLGTKKHKYKQYNSATNTIACCTAFPGITHLAKKITTSNPLTNHYDMMVTKANLLETNTCDYSQYFHNGDGDVFVANNCPDLYTNVHVQMGVYNALYANDDNYNASQLVPFISGTAVSCPSNYIPYKLEFFLPHFKNVDHALFCHSNINSVKSILNNIPKLNYNLSQYETLQGGKCNTNTCTTKLPAHLGQATHPEYTASNDNTELGPGQLAGAIIGGLVLFALIIVVIYYLYKHKYIK